MKNLGLRFARLLRLPECMARLSSIWPSWLWAWLLRLLDNTSSKNTLGKLARYEMSDQLLWLYLTNAVLLINHEIDSAYWKELELFRLPGGIDGFLLLHFPLLFIILYGLVLIVRQSFLGFIFSFILCFGGIFAFIIHTYFLRKGREEFNKSISKIILLLTLLVSIAQLIVTLFRINA